MAAFQVYSVLTTGAIVASSSGSGYYLFTGFPAQEVTIHNYGGINIWANFDACSTQCDTGDILISSCVEHQTWTHRLFDSWRIPQSVTIFATSTAAGAAQFSVVAVG